MTGKTTSTSPSTSGYVARLGDDQSLARRQGDLAVARSPTAARRPARAPGGRGRRTPAPSGRRARCRRAPRRSSPGRGPRSRCRRRCRRWSARSSDRRRRRRREACAGAAGRWSRGDPTAYDAPGRDRRRVPRPSATGFCRATAGPSTLGRCVPPPGPSMLGRPPHEPDQPFNTPITMASTYVAGGDLEYGRYANPTWTAFEDALGDARGRPLPVLRQRPGSGGDDPRPRRPRAEGGRAPARLHRLGDAARRPRGPRAGAVPAGRHHRPRRRGRRLRGRLSGVDRVADQPGDGGG